MPTTELLIARDTNGDPNVEVIAHAAELLRSGSLVAFPTETVYGLGANALSATAVSSIFTAKGRPANNPVIVHVANVVAARALVTDWPDAADALATEFWPGPLTLVLPKWENVPDVVTGGGPTVAVRVPAHPIALALLRGAGLPIAAPSANRSMLLSPTTAEHVLEGLDGRIDAVLDGGRTPGGIESTVVSLAESPPRLLRPGLVTPAQIEAVIGPISRGEVYAQIPQIAQIQGLPALPSPGMMARHYAPRAPLEIAMDGERRARELAAAGHIVGWMTHARPAAPAIAGVTLTEMPADPIGYAADLYAALHSLDARGVTRIVADALPPTDNWLALRDRLTRAATPPGTE